MAERSKFQQKAIKNYYDNRDQIALQRIQEIATELYLSTGKKRQQQWKYLRQHLGKLGVADKTIDHLIEKDDPTLVAQLATKLENKV